MDAPSPVAYTSILSERPTDHRPIPPETVPLLWASFAFAALIFGAMGVVRFVGAECKPGRGRAGPGPTAGARGNLRDSDTTPSYHKDENGKPYELFNWAVHTEMVVP